MPLCRVFFLSINWILIFGLAACTRGGKDLEVELPGGQKQKLAISETLRINLSTEPPSLDWIKSTDSTSSWVGMNIMEGLTWIDLSTKELTLTPALALKWEPSDQAKKWKFTLRPNVVWSDGQPFTAQQVIDGWRRLLSRETASEYAYFLFGIKNAQAYHQGKVAWDAVGAKVTGPLEVSVELERSMSYFPYLLTHHSTYPVRLDVIQKAGDRWTEAGTMVTLGMYTLKAWQHDKMLVLERNEKYYGKATGDMPAIKYIVGYMIIEQATAINLFDSGKLDSVHSLPSVELRKLRERKEYRASPQITTAYYGFNVTKAPLDNPLVRKAIAMSIDRQEIVQMLAGGQLPISNWIPPGMFGYEAERGITFNPEKARALFKQAGYSDPTKFPKVELKFNTNEDHQRIAENVQAQLKRNLGITLELKNEEWKVFLNTLKSDPPQMFRMGWQADYPDPDNFFNLMTSYSEQNRTRWKNLKYDEMVLSGAGTIDRDERRKIYSGAQRLMLEDDVPVIPLYTRVSHFLISPRIENYPTNVMDFFSYRKTKIKQ